LIPLNSPKKTGTQQISKKEYKEAKLLIKTAESSKEDIRIFALKSNLEEKLRKKLEKKIEAKLKALGY